MTGHLVSEPVLREASRHRPPRRRGVLGALMAFALLSAAGCQLPGRFFRGYAEAEPEGMELLEDGGAFAHAPGPLRGQVRMVFDDFGSLTTDGLETYAIPWKVAVAAVVLDREGSRGAPRTLGTFNAALEEYGFLRPTRIANWTGPQPRLDRPLGLVAGTARRGFPGVEIEIGNLGCATCHAGPVFGDDGRPTGEAWLGMPNPSVDVTAYADDVFRALRRELESPETLLAAIRDLFPEVSEREMSTLRKHVIPGAREELAIREAEYGGLVPFENGGPGLNNGVGSLRFLHGENDRPELHRTAVWASAPDLSGTSLRRSVLVDGIYSAPGAVRYGALAVDDVTDEHLGELAGAVSLFIVGTQGIEPRRARDAIPEVHDVMRFVHTLTPPPFPGAVDRALAEAGAAVYRDACAACHGRYSEGVDHPRLVEHPNRLVPQDRMLTDSLRWAAADPRSLRLLDAIGYRSVIEPLNGGGYVAPDLSGVWATAPYLHNGSIPTLWHLLHPEERPDRFMVGGHALDYERVGIAGAEGGDGIYRYPAGYEPWSRPMLYDTAEPGRSNAGHEFRNLTETQKRALLEYMKVL